jgi:hypothetical protein
MRAIGLTQLGVSEVLEVVDFPDPHPGPGEVRIRVHAVAVNPTEDSYTLAPWIGEAIGVVGAALAWILPARHVGAQRERGTDSRGLSERRR